ncbi:MAG: chaperone NapD [Pseudomonadota bacterium]|nr:chaperone NapD [Pseudomonadota bacterium]
MGICSMVVHTKPENIQSVSQALTALEGVEVHAQSKEGKLVVSIDHPEPEVCSRSMMEMQNIPGVVNASLIYEYFEEPAFEKPEEVT